MTAPMREAPDSSRFEWQEAPGGEVFRFHELKSKRAGLQKARPQERASASARRSKDERDALFPAAVFRAQVGSCSEPPPQGAFRGSALPLRRRTPSSRGLLLCQRLPAESDPLIQVGPGSPDNAHSRRYVPSRNSILREATNARDKPRAFLHRDKSRAGAQPPRLRARLANGGCALCQISGRVRQ